MEVTVNIGLRTVLLKYKIKTKNLAPLSQNERNKEFNNWELCYNKANTRIVCKHTISFDDADEWQSVLLFDGRIIDFHYDYELRKEFATKEEWASYIFQGYEYTEGEPQLYDYNVVEKVKIEI
jgi:hypothetical protein